MEFNRTWTDEQLRSSVIKNDNLSDVLRDLNLRAAGGNWKSLKKHIERLSLNTSHFDPSRKQKEALERARSKVIRCSDDDVLEINSPVSKDRVRRIFKKIVKYQCSHCLTLARHNGKRLTLQLDHINGNSSDNRKENLRWLCPNCHSQTDTYAGKGSRKI